MTIYFTSDLHLGHKNICKFRNDFTDCNEHDDFILDKIMSLGKRDILYSLGDFNFDNYINILENSSCRIKTVFGNHDSKKLYGISFLETQLPLFSYKNIWVSHAPIHPSEIRKRLGNIHGHIHGIENKFALGEKYFNVNIEMRNFEFVPFDIIRDFFSDGN